MSPLSATLSQWVMPMPKRIHLVLAGIGLLLVGLLTGVLAMLAVGPSSTERVTRVVDHVEIGRRPLPLHTTGADAPEGAAAMPEPASLNRLFREVANRVTPAVVFIQVRTEGSGGERREFEGDMRDFFRNPIPRQSVGSGVIISGDGHIVTNEHVVKNARQIRVTLADKREFEAEVVGTDASTDLAVLKVEGTDLPVMPLGNSEQVQVGDWVVAVGNPFRLTSTVTAGIVSALGRQVNIIEDNFSIEDFIQTDAAINPGNSGGALVNLRGELVGINTAIATESGSYEGYGFAIPTALVERVAKDLIAYGEVRRGYLGVSIRAVDAPLRREVGLSSIRGVYVGSVSDGSAAAEAGIRAGDVVLRIGGRDVDAPSELQSTVARYRPGDSLRVTLWRDGARRTVGVRLMGTDDRAYRQWASTLESDGSDGSDGAPGDAPGPREGPGPGAGEVPIVEIPDWGVGVRGISDREEDIFGVKGGAYVAYVAGGTPADAAGLPRDVVVLRVDSTRIDGPGALRRHIAEGEAGRRVLVEVQRRDQTRAYYEIRRPSPGDA
jgi:Do/DeqQ family serine protease